jgi:hypothetical protein
MDKNLFANAGPSPFSISIRKETNLWLKYDATFSDIYTSLSMVLQGSHHDA